MQATANADHISPTFYLPSSGLLVPLFGHSKMEEGPSNDNLEMLELANLLEKIAENPYEYDTHVVYINLLRDIGDTEYLRQAREVFHSLYPFSEGIPSLK